jgi:stringent starvation protein B
MHQWMLDNGYTPHIVVDAKRPGVRVPEAHVKDGKIVLNVSLTATRDLVLGNDAVTFEARFGGRPFRVDVPVGAVLGIYARETGQGMVFGEDDTPPPPDDGAPSLTGERRAKLKVVK